MPFLVLLLNLTILPPNAFFNIDQTYKNFRIEAYYFQFCKNNLKKYNHRLNFFLNVDDKNKSLLTIAMLKRQN